MNRYQKILLLSKGIKDFSQVVANVRDGDPVWVPHLLLRSLARNTEVENWIKHPEKLPGHTQELQQELVAVVTRLVCAFEENTSPNVSRIHVEYVQSFCAISVLREMCFADLSDMSWHDLSKQALNYLEWSIDHARSPKELSYVSKNMSHSLVGLSDQKRQQELLGPTTEAKMTELVWRQINACQSEDCLDLIEFDLEKNSLNLGAHHATTIRYIAQKRATFKISEIGR